MRVMKTIDDRGAIAPPPHAVLLVGPLPPPSGDMANQTHQLATLLEGEGCKVRVVRNNAPYRPAWIGSLRGVRALCRVIPYLVALWRGMRGVDVVHVMANSGWAWHLFAAPAVWIAALRGVPAVVNYRGGEAESFFARQFSLIRPTLLRASLIVVPSTFLQEVFARREIETTVVPNIVNLDAFHPAQRPPSDFHVLVTRNLEPIYDIATAIRAFAQVAREVPRARMTIAGSGPQRAELERLASELGVADRVRFTGRLDNTELPARYREATVALNPSLADNMPISLLEAWASGVPVVSTRVGGVPHMVEDGRTALLVEPRDEAAMAEAMLRLNRDAALAGSLALAGQRAAAPYAWTAVRGRWFAAYAEAQQTSGRVTTAGSQRGLGRSSGTTGRASR